MRKFKTEEVKELVKEYGFQLMTDDYKDNEQKLLATDCNGYKVVFKLKHLKSGHIPKPFHTSNPYTMENIYHYLKISGRNDFVRINSLEYKNANAKLSFTCLVDGHKWEATWGSFYSGKTGCPLCGVEKRRGEGNGFWKGGYTPVTKCCRKIINRWKIDSFITGNRTCDITGTKDDIVVHHLVSFNNILQEALNNTNLMLKKTIGDYSQDDIVLLQKEVLKLHYEYGLGVCLSKEVHDEFHSIYGRGDNTKEQYLEFKKNKLNNKKENNIGK